MHPARIAELLEPFLGPASEQQLTTTDFELISTYVDILLRWNTRMNLTAIRDSEEIIIRHFGESLFAARHLFPRTILGGPDGPGRLALAPEVLASNQRRDRLSLADIGSGAGFPGLPIKLWAPHIALTLIESNHKKATFLREVARALRLTDVDIQNARAEDLRASFDVVTLRAVERFTAILPVAASLVVPPGRLALLIGSAQLAPVRESLPGFACSEPIPIPHSHARVLAVAQRAK
jgi:16S rRNA (guanine527-N7)-methyltransferase